MGVGSDQTDGRCRSDKWRLAKELTVFAIAMELLHLTFAIHVRLIGLPLVLMAMVTEMRGMALLMLAIDGRRCPGILERQNRQQQNQEQFFHGRNNNIF